jgi:aspartyl protease family protein
MRDNRRMGIDDRDWYRQAQQQRQGPGPGMPGAPRRRPDTFSMVVLWLIIGAVLYLIVDGLLPGMRAPAVRAGRAAELLLSPGSDGNYEVGGSINGVPVRFIVDTGASTVSVSQTQARRMGLVGCRDTLAQTANGHVVGCIGVARDMRFGPFHAQDVQVAVLPKLGGDALLGMNVLSQLQVVQQDGRMLLRVPPRNAR